MEPMANKDRSLTKCVDKRKEILLLNLSIQAQQDEIGELMSWIGILIEAPTDYLRKPSCRKTSKTGRIE